MTIRHYKKSKINGIQSKLKSDLHLMLSGFGNQKLIPVNDILDAINKLPDTHIAGLREIKFDPNRETLLPNFITRLFHKAPKCCKGVFQQKKRTIVIYDFDSRAMFFHVLYHEIGHFVYFLTLSAQRKKDWVTNVHKTTPFVTSLSKRNAAEDFAECYSLYITEPKLLKHSPQKYDFIHQHVFNNDNDSDIENTSLYFDSVLLDKTY